jgi:hypothetical protein
LFCSDFCHFLHNKTSPVAMADEGQPVRTPVEVLIGEAREVLAHAQITIPTPKHYTNFTVGDDELDYITTMVRILHEAVEVGATRVEMKCIQGLAVEMYAGFRESHHEGCNGLALDGTMCSVRLQGELFFNSGLCAAHQSQHPISRALDCVVTGHASLPEPKGDCITCNDRVTDRHSLICLCCGRVLHLGCLERSVYEGTALSSDDGITMVCTCCAAQRILDVVFLIKALIAPGGVPSSLVFLARAPEQCFADLQSFACVNAHMLPASRTGPGFGFDSGSGSPGVATPYRGRPVELDPVAVAEAAAAAADAAAAAAFAAVIPGVAPAVVPFFVDSPAARYAVDPGAGLPGVGASLVAETAAALSAGADVRGLQELRTRLASMEELLLHSTHSHGELPSEPPANRGVDPTGVDEGFKKGDQNAPNAPGAMTFENMLGQDQSHKIHKQRVNAAVGSDTIDGQKKDRHWPEQEDTAQTLTLEGDGLSLAVHKYQCKIPLRSIFPMYVDSRVRFWEGIGKCGVDVYAPEHESYAYFSTMAGIIVLRYRFLLALIQVLSTEHDLAWEVIWRVVCTQVTRDFSVHMLHHQGPTDRELYRVLRASAERRPDLTLALARSRAELLGHTIMRAQTAAIGYSQPALGGLTHTLGALTVGTPAQRPAGGGPAAGGRGELCVLCGSRDHVYKRTADGSNRLYQHTDKMTITTVCTRGVGPFTARNREKCGKRHAFSGPIQTPCREVGAPVGPLGS